MPENSVIRIRSTDSEIHHLYVGGPGAEDYNDFVYAKKATFRSLEDFLHGAVCYLDEAYDLTDDADSYENYYRDMGYTKVEAPQDSLHISGLRRCAAGKGHAQEPVLVTIEGIVCTVNVGPQEWNYHTSILETATDYVFYIWGTTG